VLGENYRALLFSTPHKLLEAACTSERQHLLKLFVPFAMTKKLKSHGTLQNALINKNWEAAAHLYNGKDYRKYNYHIKLKEAYEKIKAGIWNI